VAAPAEKTDPPAEKTDPSYDRQSLVGNETESDLVAGHAAADRIADVAD